MIFSSFSIRSVAKQCQNIRHLYSSTKLTDNVVPNTKNLQMREWNLAVGEAEKIAGYPTCFDEVTNIAKHLKKLVGSNHPLVETAQNLIQNRNNNMQAWGLIILLVAQTAGRSSSIPDSKLNQILESQRSLAEITEMIRTAHLLHQGLVNLQCEVNAGNNLGAEHETVYGNKIALLSGDYLLGTACLQLASLKNHELLWLITSALRDLIESNFVGDRDDQNIPLPSEPEINSDQEVDPIEIGFGDLEDNIKPLKMQNVLGNAKREWYLRNILGAGTLMGKGCQGVLKLAGHSEALQKQAYIFGKHFSLGWQACIDMEPFLNSNLPQGTVLNLVSAPVLFHLKYDNSLYDEIKKGKTSIKNIDYQHIHNEVLKGPGLEETRKLQKDNALVAMNALNELPASDARTALGNLLLTMQDLYKENIVNEQQNPRRIAYMTDNS